MVTRSKDRYWFKSGFFFFIRKNYSLYSAENSKNYMEVKTMFTLIINIIVCVRDWLNCGADEFLNLMSKGAIDANTIIANGGGVWVGTAL